MLTSLTQPWHACQTYGTRSQHYGNRPRAGVQSLREACRRMPQTAALDGMGSLGGVVMKTNSGDAMTIEKRSKCSWSAGVADSNSDGMMFMVVVCVWQRPWWPWWRMQTPLSPFFLFALPLLPSSLLLISCLPLSPHAASYGKPNSSLSETRSVSSIDQEDNPVDGREVVLRSVGFERWKSCGFLMTPTGW